MYYLPGNLSSKGSANKTVEKRGILTLNLIDVKTELKKIEVQTSPEEVGIWDMWFLMFCILKPKYLSVKQLSAQFLLPDLQFLDLFMSLVFISRIHALKHFISYFHNIFSEGHYREWLFLKANDKELGINMHK